jgi:pimeloyl-ACP methyl ester carboxylesterase
MPQAKINGIDLYYETHGQGPAIVFAHGGGGSHMSWWQQVPAFSKSYQCVTFDHRGFGISREMPDGPGAASFVEDLRGLLDHLGIDQAAVVGQSMGGWTVLGFAATYPHRTRALVLCDTTAGLDDPEVRAEQALIAKRAEGGLYPRPSPRISVNASQRCISSTARSISSTIFPPNCWRACSGCVSRPIRWSSIAFPLCWSGAIRTCLSRPPRWK